MAKHKGVEDLVKYVGFVPDEQMPAYYKNSLAMVMPSYFGPTNMPPLEAFAMKTPVVVSDLPGIRDQVGEAALLVEPENPKALSEAIQRLVKEPQLRNILVQKGESRLREFSDEDRLTVLRDIFNALRSKTSYLGHRMRSIGSEA